ncbi:hypothetical protein ACWGPW_09555 [Paenibacillus chitinolyticus]
MSTSTGEGPGGYRRNSRTAGQPTAGDVLQPEAPVRHPVRIRTAAGLLF